MKLARLDEAMVVVPVVMDVYEYQDGGEEKKYIQKYQASRMMPTSGPSPPKHRTSISEHSLVMPPVT